VDVNRPPLGEQRGHVGGGEALGAFADRASLSGSYSYNRSPGHRPHPRP
jgi:hypothetical protein